MMSSENFYNNPSNIFQLSVDNKILDSNILIPLYHLVSSECQPHVSYLYSFPSIKTFESHLRFLLNRYIPVSLEDLVKYCAYGEALPHRAMHLTFDDGLRSNYENIMPILLRYGVPATFFITTAFVDNLTMFFRHKASLLLSSLASSWPNLNRMLAISKVLDREISSFDIAKKSLLSITYAQSHILDIIAQILEIDFHEYLKKSKPYVTSQSVQELISYGFSIGAHSVDHPRFSELNQKSQLCQAVTSVKYISTKFLISRPSFAFPFSDSGVEASTIKQMHDYGIIPTFGTRGLQPRTQSLHLQRLCLDSVPYID